MTGDLSDRMNLFSNIRLIIIVAIVFLVSLLFTNIIGAPVIAILAYFVLQYRRRIKDLEKRIQEVPTQTPGGPDVSAPPSPAEPPATPMSTDA